MQSPERKYWKKKKIRLEILPDGNLQVTAPPHCDINPFLEQKRDWIQKKIQDLECIAGGDRGRDDLLLFRGSWYRLTQGQTCAILEDTITYTTPSALKEMLEELLRQEIAEVSREYVPRLGCSLRSVSIRTQRTRWGSCSGEGTLNFNLTLMALPAPLRNYVILHEIVHLVERNHAPAFWKYLGTLCPDYRAHRKDLKKYWILVERNTIWRVLRKG
ncbi:MAG: M48 family metallopeptidase [Methanomicrobiales archaeon]|nr:M48 family metallopeptidase [Methanomicrobiales archaeon]